jgi:hypothetical protein
MSFNKRLSLPAEPSPSYSSLAQTLSELKHTVTAKSSSANAKGHTRRAISRIDAHADRKDSVMLMVVDGKGRKARMQVPTTSMSRLQDFLEEK